MIISNTDFGLGWKKEPTDVKDIKYTLSAPVQQKLTTVYSTDLRPFFAPVYSQGAQGSCVSNAIAGMTQYLRAKDNEQPDWIPSRSFIYYWGRFLENTIGNDSGLYNRDGMKALNRWGVCPETKWPYVVVPTDSSGNFPSGSAPVTKPPWQLGVEANVWRIVDYQKIVEQASSDNQAITKMKGCLLERYPFIFGLWLFSNWFDNGAPSTIMPFPSWSATCIGGHCMLAVGFDDVKQWFIVRNFWGDQYGEKGYFYLPYQYMQVYASDCWVGYHVAKEEFRGKVIEFTSGSNYASVGIKTEK